MFSALLPGFRQLRVPLASGAITLTVIVLLVQRFAPELPGKSTLTGFIVEVGQWAGPLPVIGALAFIAYLLGNINIVSVKLGEWIAADRKAVTRARERVAEALSAALVAARERGVRYEQVIWAFPELGEAYDEAGGSFSPNVPRVHPADRDTYLQKRSRDEEAHYEDRDAWQWFITNPAVLVKSVTEGTSEEHVLLSQRDLHERLDRDRTEGEFRRDIALPMAALLVVFGVSFTSPHSHWFVAAGVAAGLAAGAWLLITGQRRIDRYDITVWGYIINRLIPSREFEAIERLQQPETRSVPKVHS